MNDNDEKRCESGGYTLLLRLHDGEYTVTGYEGGGSRLVIPDEAEGIKITSIARKAFLANKGLRDVSLPGEMSNIEEWAFAKCENIRTIVVRQCVDGCRPKLCFGNRVFDNCHRIENICIGYEEPDSLSNLLGAVIHRMPAEYLLKDEDLGNEKWYEKWDQCLSTYLDEPDIDGYTDLVLCGEEDIFYNEPDFAMNKRRKKASLCLLRLMNDSFIKDSVKSVYIEYLKNHTKHSKTEEAWDVLMTEYGDKTDYYGLFKEIGCITADNIDDMIVDMGELHAEAKAYMLGLKRNEFSSDDIFSQFVL